MCIPTVHRCMAEHLVGGPCSDSTYSRLTVPDAHFRLSGDHTWRNDAENQTARRARRAGGFLRIESPGRIPTRKSAGLSSAAERRGERVPGTRTTGGTNPYPARPAAFLLPNLERLTAPKAPYWKSWDHRLHRPPGECVRTLGCSRPHCTHCVSPRARCHWLPGPAVGP